MNIVRLSAPERKPHCTTTFVGEEIGERVPIFLQLWTIPPSIPAGY
jgi:hypothetical protein